MLQGKNGITVWKVPLCDPTFFCTEPKKILKLSVVDQKNKLLARKILKRDPQRTLFVISMILESQIL